MKIIIDRDLCQGHSVCMEEAPDVFQVLDSPEGYPQVELLVSEPSPAAYEKVRCAARYCPNQVIRIVEK